MFLIQLSGDWIAFWVYYRKFQEKQMTLLDAGDGRNDTNVTGEGIVYSVVADKG